MPGAILPLPLHAATPTGSLVDIDDERFYEIARADALEPFLITVASADDHFLFVSSTGALTAGRGNPDRALFPYTTDDRLHDNGENTGPRTIIRAVEGGRARLWEPFSLRGAGLQRISRALAKNVRGNKLRFQETNHDLELTFAYVWMTSARFGFVRRATLTNHGSRAREIELLDGLQNLLPAGVERRFQMEYSTLVDAYKISELDPATGLALLRLASIPTDAPEPSEALRATTVWAAGLDGGGCLLCSRQLERFRGGRPLLPETTIRGQRGAYFRQASLELLPGGSHRWYLVADVEQEAPEVVSLARLLRSPDALTAALEADIAAGGDRLARIVASADGLQATADELRTIRHHNNVLYNNMRGGLPQDGYQLSREDLVRFIADSSRRVHARHRAFLEALPQTITHQDLLESSRRQRDPDLERLTLEYLPLTFSRRHGDPSRPWNLFQIAVRDRAGRPLFDYQGNWRDIFQNWEALALSFPDYLEGMIARFLDASTADGHNPYRVTRAGFEWEVKDPRDPWSHIGYWGDHQVVYLLRLLELSARYNPGRLAVLLDRPIFTYADVPYRIKPYPALLADPKDTIEFDQAAHQAAMDRAARLGADGKLVLDRDQDPYRVNLVEKLMVLVLARMASFVPGAGLWLHTQRPEWNDANNALVGHGASVVTLCYLRRFLTFFSGLLPGSTTAAFPVSAELAGAFGRMADTLAAAEGHPAAEEQRRRLLDGLAGPWSDYRTRLYRDGFAGTRTPVAAAALRSFCDSALRHIDLTIAANRRADGLYHAYNLIQIEADRVHIRRLPEMLEGQVAVLSSGTLPAAAALDLLDALASSALFRPDQQSYLLYPDRELPAFLERNRLPPDAVASSPLLTALLAEPDPPAQAALVRRDPDGGVHFAADLRNARILASTLDALAAGPRGPLVAAERRSVLELYERLFDHQSFTGRSGSFFKYEGLGSIYWHMVSKLLVAVQEVIGPGPPDDAVTARLRAHLRTIQEGLGVHKSPAVHGAFPIDPYSHTPAHAGAQQPGLTGQVKEDIIARFRELGVVVEGGELRFDPTLLQPEEFLTSPQLFRSCDREGRWRALQLPAGSLAFTVCQVPVVYHLSAEPFLRVILSDASQVALAGLRLGPSLSRALFDRTGEIRHIDVWVPLHPTTPNRKTS